MKDVESALAAFAGIVRPPGRDSQPIMIAEYYAEGTPMPGAVGTPLPGAVGTPIPMPMPAAVVALPPARRSSALWLAAAILVAGAGAGSFALEPKPNTQAPHPNLVLLKNDGEKIATTIESALKAAQLRVDGIAQTPMLRAAIETDTATVQDLFKSELK